MTAAEVLYAETHIRSIEQIQHDTKRMIDPIIHRSICDLPGELGSMARFHFGWPDIAVRGAEIPPTGGKAVRPALMLLCAEAIDPASARPLSVAAAVELVHNFSLIHDDVMDGDRERRHRPTLWAKYDVANAILVGDALLALAFRVLAGSAPALAAAGARELGGSVIALCEGQRRDVDFEQLDTVPVADCLAMLMDKTGALMRCACVLGGLSAGASETQLRELGAFGDHIGLAFQLVDDYLGIWGAPEVTGKPVGNDLVNKKKSLPVAVALNAPDGRELVELYRRPGPLAGADVARAKELIEGVGAREWLRQRVRAESAAALECLHRLDGSGSPAIHELAELTESLAVRIW